MWPFGAASSAPASEPCQQRATLSAGQGQSNAGLTVCKLSLGVLLHGDRKLA